MAINILLLNLEGISNESKMLLMEKCGEIEFRMTEGSDEFYTIGSVIESVCALWE